MGHTAASATEALQARAGGPVIDATKSKVLTQPQDGSRDRQYTTTHHKTSFSDNTQAERELA